VTALPSVMGSIKTFRNIMTLIYDIFSVDTIPDKEEEIEKILNVDLTNLLTAGLQQPQQQTFSVVERETTNSLLSLLEWCSLFFNAARKVRFSSENICCIARITIFSSLHSLIRGFFISRRYRILGDVFALQKYRILLLPHQHIL
jgi:hypothetical protein